MSEKLSIQYEAKGEKEFIFPFFIAVETEIVVWVNNVLQSKSNYYIKFNKAESQNELQVTSANRGGKVIFLKAVGSEANPKIVTIEKNSSIERKSDFSDFSTFRAESLNLELNNFIDILNSLQLRVNSSVQKSKLEENEVVVIFPKKTKGKGIYWGENGELLNTDQDLNDLLNSLAELYPDIPSAKIAATKISVDTASTEIKKDNAQDFIKELDKAATQFKTTDDNLTAALEQNNTNLTAITTIVNDTLAPELQSATANIATMQNTITELQTAISDLPSGKGSLYAVTAYPENQAGEANYLIKSNKTYSLNIVNISNDNPLILNFAYNGNKVLFKGDDIAKFYKPICNMPHTGAGRYYIRAELKNDDRLNLVASIYRPYFGLSKPSDDILTASGCTPGKSDYFVITDMSFYGGSGQFKDQPAKYIYLGYVDLNENGEIISNITYFTKSGSFEYFLDVAANQSYTIPNLLGCNCIDVKIYAFYQNNFLPVCNQGKFNKDEVAILEMGTNFSYSLDQITINTAKAGVFGYYRGSDIVSSNTAKLKIIVTRDF